MDSDIGIKEAFVEAVKTRPEEAVQINSLIEYIEFISAINDLFLQIIYRGQADAEWQVDSSAYRHLNEPTQEDLYKYHSSLVSNSKYLHEENLDNLKKVSDLMFLTYLQHHGAKTNLIDFTENPLVALWFACSDYDKKDAVVCWKSAGFESIGESKGFEKIFSDETQKLFKFVPPLFDRRIMAQCSVFLFPPHGKIESYQYHKIIIPAESKKSILCNLELVGISRKTLFPDFSGFVEWFDYNGKDRLSTLLEEGNLMKSQNNLSRALEIYLEAETLGEVLFGTTDSRQALIYSEIGSIYNDLKDLGLALQYHTKAMVIRESVFGENNPETAKSYNGIAMQLRQRDRFDEAIDVYSKVERIRLTHYGSDHPDTASVYNNIGFMYYKKDDLINALVYLNKCREIRERVSSTSVLSKAVIYQNIARVYLAQGDKIEEAKDLSDESLLIRERVRGEKHLTTSFSNLLCAEVELALCHYDNAYDFLEKSLTIRIEQRGVKSKLVGDCYNIKAKIAFAEGKYEEALSIYGKAQDIKEKVLGKENSETAIIYAGIAETNFRLNRFSEAERYATLACSVYKRVFEEGSRKVIEIESLLCDISKGLDADRMKR